MARHVLTVCIFCIICATHTPCASHVAIDDKGQHNFEDITYASKEPLILNPYKPHEKFKSEVINNTISDKNNNSSVKTKKNDVNLPVLSLYKRDINDNVNSTELNNSSYSKTKTEDYLQKIFSIYGDGNSMSIEGFEKLMERLDLLRTLSMKLDTLSSNSVNLSNIAANEAATNVNSTTINNSTCINREDILSTLISSQNLKSENISDKVSNDTLIEACPAILYSMVVGVCNHETAAHVHIAEPSVSTQYNNPMVWIYSNLAVTLISACGVLGLAVIPIMQKWFYQPLLQFLVALAVGTLAGDALLHLLPHAMSPRHNHDEQEAHIHTHGHGDNSQHDENMWKGFVAMLGLIFFFLMERIILFVAKWRKGRQLSKLKNPKVKIIAKIGAESSRSGEKQCVNKYSSFPLCYNDIISPNHAKMLEDSTEMDTTATTIMNDYDDTSAPNNYKKNSIDKHGSHHNINDGPNDLDGTCTEMNEMLSIGEKDNTDYTIILREHENRHHGHTHAHGHVHAAPKSISSVAWMVIMGDGLHNFTDGMAIGAAFAGSTAGGFSTAVAVFCHELPHELGDFAMLLKAGMSMKQALYYNLISSVLCFLGNTFGVMLGNTPNASSWVFAIAAGMFIYIALVDMIPELSAAHEDEGNLLQCLLHFGGLFSGFIIMTLIAVYEHDLKNIFHDPE